MGTEMWWDVVGMLAAACTSGGLIPQLVRGGRTQRLDDVSPGLLILLTIGCTLWFLYGMHKWDKIIMGANAFVVVLATTIFLLRAYYIKRRDKGHVGRYAKRYR